MRYLSICSGIEAASVAWEPLGWDPVAFAENDRFPSAVLAHHHPHVPNHGDITKFEEWPDYAIDLLVGGTPCQSFSVAGLRKGLDDPRGNLMLTYLAIARRYQPRWLVWENVPGVLSSNKGRDFGAFIRGVEECGYHAAWRVLDAQYVRVDGHTRAVPQRRRRVFVVGHLGDWRRAAAVLLEREGLQGHPAPRREAGEGTADATEIGFGGGRCAGPIDVAARLAAHGVRQDFDVETFITSREVAATLTRGAESAGKGGYAGRRQEDDENLVAARTAPPLTLNPYGDHESREDLLVAHSLRGEGFDASEDGTGRGTPIVPVDLTNCSIGDGVSGTLEHAQHKTNRGQAVAIQERATSENPDNGPDGKGWRDDGAAYTVEARSVQQAVAFDTTQITSKENRSQPKSGDPSHPLAAAAHPPAIAWSIMPQNSGKDYKARAVDVAQTVMAGGPVGGNHGGDYIQEAWAVRRLTPRECERLQGFPDDFTNIPWRNKPEAPDGPRYKALGNSMAVNVMRWIGRRIDMVDAISKEAAE